jgi:polyisoprenoid-binding protein YceI
VARHRRLFIGLAILIVLAVIGGGVGLWYILIGPAAPASVNAAPPAIPSGAPVAVPASLDGAWNVADNLGSMSDASATFAGYRVQEQLAGVGGHTAVGRTPKVTGSMSLKGTVVSDVQITVDMTGLVSDDKFRDDELRTRGIQTDTFPTASFKTNEPVDLGSLPSEGQTVTVNAKGDLTLHGVTKTVTMSLQARRVGGIIAVTGSTPINFADWSIQKPVSFAVVSVDDHGTMEVHLLFTHA